MRFKPLLRAMGYLFVGEAVLMFPSLIVAILYNEGDIMAFVYTISLLLIIGFPLTLFIKTKVRELYSREGFALVGFSWIVLSLFGMLPFLFSGVISSPIDAFFETVSGFTTTGSSILKAVEGLPHGILFWRSFTHWVGGMGILVFTIALLPQLGLRNMEVLRAESPGPSPEKLVPRIRQTARMLYGIYLLMSVILFVLLLLTGMHPFDSAVNTFGAAGTGGFSVLNASIGGYNNPVAEIILGVFMLLFGVNFTVYFMLFIRNWKKAFSNGELMLYGGIVLCSVLLITVDILPRFANFGEALRVSFFQVASIMTTTGYATTDFNVTFPPFAQCILLALMFIGASAGSTGGGIKVSRVLISIKSLRHDLHQLLHPRIVRPIMMDGKPVEDGVIRSVLVFIFTYVFIIVISTLVISLDRFDFLTSFSATMATISNIGPGLGVVGPAGNFSAFSDLSKLMMSFNMLVGRLEIMPIFLLITTSLWRKR